MTQRALIHGQLPQEREIPSFTYLSGETRECVCVAFWPRIQVSRGDERYFVWVFLTLRDLGTVSTACESS